MQFTTQLRNTQNQWGWIAIIVHWLMAIAILGMYPLGLYIVSLGYYDPGYRIYPDLHRSIGVLLALVLALRLTWRALNKSPKPLAQHQLERIAAHLGHIGLYVLIAVVVSSGYLMSTADGRSVQVFSWFSVPAIEALSNRQEEFWGQVHFYSATLMMILVAVHAVAALRHHFFKKDATLKRMAGIQSEDSQ